MFASLLQRFSAISVCGVAVALAAAPAANANAGCDLVASPTGSDAAAGTEVAPLRSAQKLVDALAPGQTGCLRAGKYDAVQFFHGNLTLRSWPGERAEMVGRLYVPEKSDSVTVRDLYLDGTNAKDLPSPTINARDTTFLNNDVTSNHTAICFSLGHADWGSAINTRLEANRVHDCGRLPATNQGHGIYVNEARNATIANNWIYDNADRGIQLFPDAQGTKIIGNVIDGNGEGIIFSGTDRTASSDTVVERNAITNSQIRNNVESWYPSGAPIGQRNTVRNNCISGGAEGGDGGGIGTEKGFEAIANPNQAPTYAGRAADDYRLTASSACRSVLPAPDATPGPDAQPARASLPAPVAQRPQVVLNVDDRTAQPGRQVPVSGQVSQTAAAPGAKVLIMVRTTGRWHRIGRSKVRSNSKFRAKPRLRVRTSRAGAVRMRAVIRGVGRSQPVRLRLRSR